MTKTVTFAAMHFSVAFTVAYMTTGRVWLDDAIALVAPAMNTVAYHFHEQVWNRIRNVEANVTHRLAHPM